MPQTTINFYSARMQAVLLVVLGIVMTGVSLAFPIGISVLGDADLNSLALAALGLGAGGFFAWCTLVAVAIAVRRKPVITLDERGIKIWRYPRMSWPNFHRVAIGTSSGEAFLSVQALDRDLYQSEMCWASRRWIQLSQTLMPGDIYLSARLLNQPVREVARQIADFAATRRE